MSPSPSSSTTIVTGHPSTQGDSSQLNTTTLIRHAARTYPEQEIVSRTIDGGWDRYTYGDCYARVQRQANVLVGLGVTPGDVVGVLDWNSKRFFELYWSVPGVGAVLLQMNIRLGAADLTYIAGHSQASVVLVDESLLPLAEQIAPQCPTVRTWVIMSDKPMTQIQTSLPGAVHLEALMAAAEASYDWPVIDENSACSACYTTGTTGRPKGVYFSHRALYLHTYGSAVALGINADDCFMLITPMFHANCWGMPQAAALVAAKVVLTGRYAAEDTSVLVDAMIAEHVTVANGAPAIFQPMLDYIRTLPTPPDLSRARLVSGSTEPALSLMRGFFDVCGADVIHAYGATETTPIASINGRLKASLRATYDDDARWDVKRCQGLPLSGVDIRIVDPLGNDLPFDGEAQGEIWLRGPWVTESYWQMDADDAADRFDGGWWRSGDVGKIDRHGYLKLTDRLKDVVKSGGEWISSIDMENKIVGHPLVKEAAIVGVAHPKWQERPIAIVVPVEGAELTLADICATLEGSFAKWQMPDTVVFTSALPRTSVGKLDKKVMRVEYADTYRDPA